MDFISQINAIAASDVFVGAQKEGSKLTDDTRDIARGDIFVLRQGAQPLAPDMARRLCSDAQNAGARAIILDPAFPANFNVPSLPLSNPHAHLLELARAFWGDPSKDMEIIAVTGTNGKTTTTYLIEAIACAMGVKAGVLGTVSYRYPGYEEPSANTTPGTLKLQRLLRQMANAGCRIVAMEVSSHGIMQGRIDGIAFDVAVWNNLGTDHLDFHKTREAYADAKRRLFSHYLALSFAAGKTPTAVFNADDEEVARLIHDADPGSWGKKTLAFSCDPPKKADLTVRRMQWQDNCWKLGIHWKNTAFQTVFPLVGAYNVANLAGAMSALAAVGFDFARIVLAASKIPQIPGRMECVRHAPLVVVDFAHTPEALDNALKAAKNSLPANGRLILIFGAGGDRDPSKRPMMGEIAQKRADIVFVTSDNPRTEDPAEIIRQIVAGMAPDSARIFVDRKTAIEQALAIAAPSDVVLIAGKGHEDYQIIGTQKIRFSDQETVRRYYDIHPALG